MHVCNATVICDAVIAVLKERNKQKKTKTKNTNLQAARNLKESCLSTVLSVWATV